jgi:hypothetical protein
MNMSSVRELEAQSAVERKKLMQTLFDHLKEQGIEISLAEELSTNYLGMAFQESVIRLNKSPLNIIRLVGLDSDGCGVPGNILRFQYELRPSKNLSNELIEKVKAETQLIREGKVMGFLGGKVTGVKWSGQEIADILNRDSAISKAIFDCTKSWAYLEYNIQASADRVDILGPRFTDPERIMQLYLSELKNEVECCLFGFRMVERIAENISDFISSRSRSN